MNVVVSSARALLIFLLMQHLLLLAGRADTMSAIAGEQVGENQMTSNNDKNDSNKENSAPPAVPDVVNTPAGPVPRDKVHEVMPGETVRQNKDGSLTKAPLADKK
jgi:hypothetical protein